MDSVNLMLAGLLLVSSCYLMTHVEATKRRHQLLIAKAAGGWDEYESGLSKDALNCFHRQSKWLVSTLIFFTIADTALKTTSNYLLYPNGEDYTCTDNTNVLAVSDNAAILMAGLSVDLLAYVFVFWVILYKIPQGQGLVSAGRSTRRVVLPALDDMCLLSEQNRKSMLGSFTPQDECRLLQTNNTTTEVFDSENAAKARSMPLINSLGSYYLDKECIEAGRGNEYL